MDKKYDVQFCTRNGNAGGGYMTDEKTISEGIYRRQKDERVHWLSF